eukprot:GHVU01047752.1.p1 GENE.GHVU01047752.1~~GHVU01047752.1.p1  ORF type:complete len:156 (-),score=21.32 GHVU01047752.1:27-494(-)
MHTRAPTHTGIRTRTRIRSIAERATNATAQMHMHTPTVARIHAVARIHSQLRGGADGIDTLQETSEDTWIERQPTHTLRQTDTWAHTRGETHGCTSFSPSSSYRIPSNCASAVTRLPCIDMYVYIYGCTRTYLHTQKEEKEEKEGKEEKEEKEEK